jgi:hypothetical protein
LLLPGNISLQLSGLPLLLFFHKSCLTLTMVRPSQQQRPFNPISVSTMRWNLRSGSASLRRSSPWRASNHRKSATPMLWPACPSKSFGTFRTQLMSATDQINLLIF